MLLTATNTCFEGNAAHWILPVRKPLWNEPEVLLENDYTEQRALGYKCF